jgi:acyl-CoA synthetase (AMP-forming)/AMP-acid ligase II
MNLAWWLDRAADEYADRIAIVDGRENREVTYRELVALTDQLAGALRDDLGIGPDEVVGTLAADDHWHLALFYALLKIGAVFNGLNRTLTPQRLADDVARSGARTIVVSPEYADAGRELLQTSGVERVLVSGAAIGDEFPDLRALAAARSGEIRVAPRTNDDVAAINFTGGTAGVGKGVIFTHGKLALSAQVAVFHCGLRSRDVNLSCISMYHSGGLHDAVKWVMAGAANVLTGGWKADLAADLIARYRPTWIFFWVPTMIRDLMTHQAWNDLPLEGVRANLTGEKVPVELHQQLLARGMRVANAYGLTETMPYAVFAHMFRYGDDAIAPVGASGRTSLEMNECVLKDPLSGETLEGPGVEGEVCIRGDNVTPGYYNDPVRTAAALDQEGFFHTRDLAKRDADDFYWVGGRTDDIINTGAEKLSLLEVEEALRTHPDLVDVACAGVRHTRFGQVPAAFVVDGDDRPEDELAEVLDAHCLGTLERWKRPRLYVKLDAIPRTAAKRTKSLPDLRALLEGLEVSDADGVTTLGRLRESQANLGKQKTS